MATERAEYEEQEGRKLDAHETATMARVAGWLHPRTAPEPAGHSSSSPAQTPRPTETPSRPLKIPRHATGESNVGPAPTVDTPDPQADHKTTQTRCIALKTLYPPTQYVPRISGNQAPAEPKSNTQQAPGGSFLWSNARPSGAL